GKIGEPAGARDDGTGPDKSPTATFGSTVGRDNPVAIPFAHLTAAEYRSTVRDLFAQVAIPAVSLPADVIVEGFDNNAAVQTPTADLIDAYESAAATIAQTVMASSSQVLGCSPSSRAAEDACATTFIGELAAKAYRRPLDGDELTDLSSY